ncbi:hypothetical protein [Brasilonema sp. UFV-L1]|uniref:hypothetical protein n=1 Tax=Brasilonema sp. UFV-L1 TaxID=2234130 RepID=UPI00145CF8D0|nr:hypothetical protein [Brasilonema sp. UFV-L1]
MLKFFFKYADTGTADSLEKFFQMVSRREEVELSQNIYQTRVIKVRAVLVSSVP